MATRAVNKRKQKMDPAVKLALSIVPAAQVQNAQFLIADVANRTDADQRHMVRSGERRTVRRKTNIEIFVSYRLISPRQGEILQWYRDQHEIGYSTIGCTANYGGISGNGVAADTLLARHADQFNARQMYNHARSFIPHGLRHLVERHVIESHTARGKPRLPSTFRYAVELLSKGVDQLVPTGYSA